MQMFFKEFTIMLSGDGIFCKHLTDTLVHRIDVLNTMEWASELQEGVYHLIYYKYKLLKRNILYFQGAIYQQTFFFYVDTLRLLAKFLAFAIYNPYKDYDVLNPALKEYLWEVRSKVICILILYFYFNLNFNIMFII